MVFPNQRVNGIGNKKLEKKRIGRVLDTGMFDAQIVVASVEKVVAVDESELRKAAPVPH
jgi:hypothetical protein